MRMFLATKTLVAARSILDRAIMREGVILSDSFVLAARKLGA